jgi:hypothetical protein
MDPVSIVLAALAAGSAESTKITAGEAVKDAYGALKALLKHKYMRSDLNALEPTVVQKTLRDELVAAGASGDQELIQATRDLIAVLERQTPGTGAILGVDLLEVHASNLRIGKIESSGTGVRVQRSTFQGDIEVGEINARGNTEATNPPLRLRT